MHPDPRAGSGPTDFLPVVKPQTEVVFHPGKGKDRYYLIDGEREIDGLPIVSVTTILKEVGDKFGVAAWWGMQTGVAGVLEVLRRDGVHAMSIRERKVDAKGLVDILTKCKLTTNHVRDAAGDRGTSVHALAEKWADTGEWPVPDELPVEQKPYAIALEEFLSKEAPVAKESEVVVGSKTQAYAGTFDLEAVFPDGRTALIDYKTKTSPPKGKPKAYEQHHLQLTAYEAARIEMGYEPTDFQAIVNLYPDGTYALIENKATFHQWLACLNAYRSLCDLRDALKAKA